MTDHYFATGKTPQLETMLLTIKLYLTNSLSLLYCLLDYHGMQQMNDAKRELITLAKIPMEEEYIFQVDGNIIEARRMVQRIRVELSRARTKVTERGGMLKPFKIILVNLDEKDVGARIVTFVTLLKTITNSGKKTMMAQEFMKELGDFL